MNSKNSEEVRPASESDLTMALKLAHDAHRWKVTATYPILLFMAVGSFLAGTINILSDFTNTFFKSMLLGGLIAVSIGLIIFSFIFYHRGLRAAAQAGKPLCARQAMRREHWWLTGICTAILIVGVSADFLIQGLAPRAFAVSASVVCFIVFPTYLVISSYRLGLWELICVAVCFEMPLLGMLLEFSGVLLENALIICFVFQTLCFLVSGLSFRSRWQSWITSLPEQKNEGGQR